MTDLYTCDGKGGEYQLLGTSKGAGTCRGDIPLVIYRDTADRQLYHRVEPDFATRMRPLLLRDIMPERKAALLASNQVAAAPSMVNLAASLRTIILDAKAARHWKIADEARNALHMVAVIHKQPELE